MIRFPLSDIRFALQMKAWEMKQPEAWRGPIIGIVHSCKHGKPVPVFVNHPQVLL